MTKRVLPFLEMMTTNVCNLSCEGCTTFSDLDHRGYLTWQQAQDQLEPWLARIELEAFGFMGGEPLINPDIRNWLEGVRALMPEAQIRFITNGILLEKHWWVVDLLDQLGNAVLKISRHISDDRVDSAVKRVFDSREWALIQEFGINRWKSPTGLRFQISAPTQFLKTFQGTYDDMRPHHNDPRAAFEICVQQRCPLLYQGRLFKCGTVALTPGVLDRHGWPNRDLWQPYLVSGLDVDCDDRELESFIANFGRPHALCRQCPSSQDQHSMLDHATTVKFK